jgi:two-component system chemotaxis response regulator CheY
MIPRVDGIKVLKAIRDLENQKGILPVNRAKVIITTALSGSDFAQKAFEIGCEGFIEKPIDIERLTEVIDRLDFRK